MEQANELRKKKAEEARLLQEQRLLAAKSKNEHMIEKQRQVIIG